MLTDDLLKERYAARLDQLIELADKEISRTRDEPYYRRIAQMYMGGWDGTVPVLKDILAGGPIRATGALDAIKIGQTAVSATINAVEGKGPDKVNFPYVLASQSHPQAARQLLKRFESVTPAS